MGKDYFFAPRIIRSPQSDCWGDELGTAQKAYTDEYLSAIARQGFSAIWVHLALRTIVPTNLFPKVPGRNLLLLNRLIAKAAKYGIKVYAYLLEPRAPRSNDPVWKRHPDCKGQPQTFAGIHPSFDDTYIALCTGTEKVKKYLEEGCYTLFKKAPGLAGAFLINASEQHTHCYSHFPVGMKTFTEPAMEEWAKQKFTCPRCIRRKPADVTAEAITLINRGIKRASPGADVIVWTWSWYILEPDPQKHLIGLLPKDVILMSDWERGGSKKVLGKEYPVDEYSFSSIGPSPRFLAQHRIARCRGMKVMAKIQIGTTHEFTAAPYLPVPFLLAEKFVRMRKLGVNGYLGCWVIGGDACPMSNVAGLMSRRPAVGPESAVRNVAEDEFGKQPAKDVIAAWRWFSKAWREFPFSIPVLYNGPMNYGTAFPLSLDIPSAPPPAPWLSLPRDTSGHVVWSYNEEWLSPFGPAIAARAFGKLLEQWDRGVSFLEAACRKNPRNGKLRGELLLGSHIACCFRSTVNIIRFYRLKISLEKTKGVSAQARLRKNMVSIITAEKVNVEKELDILIEDEQIGNGKRLGYHSEAHCNLFTVKDIVEKLDELERISVFLSR